MAAETLLIKRRPSKSRHCWKVNGDRVIFFCVRRVESTSAGHRPISRRRLSIVCLVRIFTVHFFYLKRTSDCNSDRACTGTGRLLFCWAAAVRISNTRYLFCVAVIYVIRAVIALYLRDDCAIRIFPARSPTAALNGLFRCRSASAWFETTQENNIYISCQIPKKTKLNALPIVIIGCRPFCLWIKHKYFPSSACRQSSIYFKRHLLHNSFVNYNQALQE